MVRTMKTYNEILGEGQVINGQLMMLFEGYYTLVGLFRCNKTIFSYVVSSDEEWEVLSIANEKRYPTYEELRMAKELFFKPDEYAVQYYPPHNDHVPIVKEAQYMIYLMRPKLNKFPTPPVIIS